MGEPAYNLPEEDKPDIRPDLSAQESRPQFGVIKGGGDTSEPKRGHLRSVDGEDSAAKDERKKLGLPNFEKPEYGTSALQDVTGKLGAGFSGGKGATSSLTGLFKGTSKNKKRAMGGGALGAGIIALIFAFFAFMAPLRIEAMITNLDNRFGAATNQAMGDASTKLFDRWVAKNIMPNLIKGTCKSTVSAGCVSDDRGTGPVSKLYQSWKQGKLEQKMASKYDIVIGRQGNKFYINLPNANASITQSDAERLVRGETDLFSLASENDRNGALRVSRSEIRQTFNDALKNETLMRRVYDRYQLGPLLEKKYGVKRCIIACNARDNFADKSEDKRLFAKATFIKRVVEPLSENYAFMFGCILDSSSSSCGTDLEPANSDDTDRQSNGERAVNANLTRLASRIAPETAEKLAASSRNISEKGITAHLTEKVVDKLVGKFAGEAAGQVTGKAAADAIPFVGWALLIIQLAGTAQDIGPMVKTVGYAVNAAAAVQTYSMYATTVSEMHSGHMDLEELGSMNTALNTNMSGSKEDRSDATQTPLYSHYNSTTQTKQVSGLSPFSKAYANTADSGGYLCANKEPVPKGELVCEEEKLDRGNDTAGFISKAVDAELAVIPGGDQIVGGVGWISSKIGGIVGDLIGLAHLQQLCNAISPCKEANALVKELAPRLIGVIMNQVMKPMVTDHMSGGRIYDSVAAGSDISNDCQITLGCAELNNKQATLIKDTYLAAQQKEFNKKPMFARMFSTDTPYSLVSRVALATPQSFESGRDSLIGTLGNPSNLLRSIGAVFANPGSAFAATGDEEDPFGIVQTGYVETPDNPDIFWDQNCVNGPLAKYDEATNKLDISTWLNAQQPDPDTGQAVAKVANPCLLIQATVIAAGGLYDPSLLPNVPGQAAGENTGAGAAFRIASFNVCYSGATEAACPSIPNVANWSARMDKSIKTILDNHLEVVGLQEIRLNQYQKIKQDLGDRYGIYTDNPGAAGYALQNIIIWDKSKFSLVEGKTVPGATVTGGPNKPSSNTLVRLRAGSTDGATGSGQEFYVLNTHEPVGSPASYRYESATAMVSKVQELSKEGIPVFVTGDFNSKYSPADDRQGVYKDISYCMLTRTGLVWDAFDADKKRTGTCPSKDKSDRPHDVDHIYMSTNVEVTNYDYSIARGVDNNGSDHNTLFADVVIPGAADTGTAAPGKDFVGNDGFGGGWCTDYVKWILARHSSKYRGGSLGDGKDVARSLGSLYGYTVNNTPAVHAVVSFPGPPFGFVGDRYAGHVALVAQVNKDGSIVVEEANYSNSKSYGTHTVSAAQAKTFTYAHTEVGWR